MALAAGRRAPGRHAGSADPAPLRVVVVGLRGVVGVQGGIETHARMLYPLLAKLGCAIEIVQRSPYYPRNRREERRHQWHGIRLTYLWSPMRRSFETGVHSLLGVLYAAWKRPDILHLHAVGPGLLAPLARLLGLRVVLTYHAPDYEREKFNALEKRLLRTGERLGVGFANALIAVSAASKLDLEKRFGVGVAHIPNGAPIVVRSHGRRTLETFGLRARRYILCVGRLDPVKRHVDVIAAFERARLPGWKLVIVGAIEPDAYSSNLCERAAGNPAIVLTDYQHGAALRELYTHAGLFVLASSLEGHPIALLEALSYALPVVASAIPANLVVPLPRDAFFTVGDVAGLAMRLITMTGDSQAQRPEWQRMPAVIRQRFSWRNAATLTRSVYADALPQRRMAGRVKTMHG